MNRVALVVLVLLIAAGCGGKSRQVDPDPAPGVYPASLGLANTGRLIPAPAGAGVTGEIRIEGFTVIDENRNHVNQGDEGFKPLARLLDPTDDILSVVIPDADGKYQLLTSNAIIEAKLQVQVDVAEDINGDGVGNDTIVQVMPVKLVAGRLARVDLTIRPGTVHLVGDELLPAMNSGAAVAVEFQRTDGNGFLDEFFVSLPEGLVYFDDNNNGFIEPGADTFYDDTDMNGWPDQGESEFGTATGQPFFLRGTVTNVDAARRRLIVRVERAAVIGDAGDVEQPQLVGTNLTVELNNFANTEILGNSPDADGSIALTDFSGQFLLDSSLVGRSVYVEGYYDGNTVFASLVLQTPKEPGDIPAPPAG